MIKNNKKGFTLVEMLIVIAIIAVLASISLVSVGGIRKSANDKRRVADLQKVQGYLELYYNQNRQYPQLNSYEQLEGVLVGAQVANALPRDTGGVYEYGSNDGQHYVLKATLETSDSLLGDANELDGTQQGIECGSASNDTTKTYCVGM